jgi:hypothetical protein
MENMMDNRFTAGFAAFNFLFWLPLTMIGGAMIGDHFADQFRNASTATQIGVTYLWLMVGMAPMFIKSFFGKSEV